MPHLYSPDAVRSFWKVRATTRLVLQVRGRIREDASPDADEASLHVEYKSSHGSIISPSPSIFVANTCLHISPYLSMLVLTPVSSLPSNTYSTRPYPSSSYGRDYYNAIASRAAFDSAVAYARAEATRTRILQAQHQQRLNDFYYQVAAEALLQQAPALGYPSTSFATSSWPDTYSQADEYASLIEQGRRIAIARERERALAAASAHRAEQEKVLAALFSGANHQPGSKTGPSSVSVRRSPVSSTLLTTVFNLSELQGPRSLRSEVPGTSQPPMLSLFPKYSQDRLRRRESKPDVRANDILSSLASQHQTSLPIPKVNHLDKGKARETPAIPLPSRSISQNVATGVPVDSLPKTTAPTTSAATETLDIASVANLLLQRLQTEKDPEVESSLNSLFSKLSGKARDASVKSETTSTAAHDEGEIASAAVPQSSEEVSRKNGKCVESGKNLYAPSSQAMDSNLDGAKLDRTPVISSAAAEKILAFYRSRRARRESLGAIKEIEDTLRALEASFVLPDHLDFSPSPSDLHKKLGAENGLTYTPNNTVVHSYEHSLNKLLERLDSIDSRGDFEVRGRRREVVKEVERALREVESRVERSRERSRERDSMKDVQCQPPAGQSVQPSGREEEAEHIEDNTFAKIQAPVQDLLVTFDSTDSAPEEADSDHFVDTAATVSEYGPSHDVSQEDVPILALSSTVLSPLSPSHQVPNSTESVTPLELTSTVIHDAHGQDGELAPLVDSCILGLVGNEFCGQDTITSPHVDVRALSDASSPVVFNLSDLDMTTVASPEPSAEPRDNSSSAQNVEMESPLLALQAQNASDADSHEVHIVDIPPAAKASYDHDSFLLSTSPVETSGRLPAPSPQADDIEIISQDDSAVSDASEWSEVEA
ncbi:uncharacterized protein FIBRA_08164 [Fibroporia radiculosa]|uniref:BAG domain-containing protein n=1 Tax=Fibroporia radiculosa TaxID=599839 RepID=J4IC76_9APHY|nr:uncharacterized protein FIBRA_08164 [Fibroporia radiculosa]CCM05926.1 predicted protein [Fibroporia radiculosa]